MPGNRYASIQNPAMYRALRRRRGMSKRQAAMVSNGRTPGHTVKAPNYGARAGQVIAGNLARGGDGKFTSGSGGQPTARQSRADARRQARQQRTEQRAVSREDAGRAEDATRAQEDAYVAEGGTPKERAARRRAVAAARRDRTRQAREARRAAAAEERMSRAQEAAAERAQQQADAANTPAGGGGGGGKATPSDDEKRAEQDKKRAAQAVATAQRAGQDTTFVDGLRAATEGRLDGPAPRLEALGFASGGEATDQGRRALSALERGDVRGYLAAVQDAKARMGREAATAARRAAAETRRQQRDAERAARDAERAARSKKSIAVFKDAGGRDRWLTITTTAYEDTDREIITVKGIAHAVAHGDATGERGTLRVWHVPGLDLGTCDYQAQGGPGGRWLIESGTFDGPREAAIGRKMAGAGWHMSPGFLHPASEPYPAQVEGRSVGLFDHPVLFERSTTPPGRAANRFGRFMTKETRMLTDEKRAALKELIGDDTLLADLLAKVETTDKAAQGAGVAFKEVTPSSELDALRAEVASLAATVKALTEKAPMPPAEMEEAGATEVADGLAEAETAEADDGGDESIITAAEAAMIAQAVAEALAPMLGELKTGMELGKKVDGYLGEMKTLLGGVATKEAGTAASIAALTADVALLKGDAPAATQRALGIGVPAELAETVKTASGEGWNGVDSFMAAFLNGAAR